MKSERLIKAETLFEAGNFIESLNVCTEMINDKEDSNEAMLLGAKIALTLFPPINEENRNRLTSYIGSLGNQMKSPEEMLEYETKFLEYWETWEPAYLMMKIDEIVEDPDFDKWKVFIHLSPELIMGRILAGVSIRTKQRELYCAENNCEAKEFGEKYPAYSVKDAKEATKPYMLEAANRLYNAAEQYLANEAAGANTTYLQQVINYYIRVMTLAGLMASYTVNSREETEDNLPGLKLQVEIKTALLNRIVMVNGNPMSVVANNRDKTIAEIKEANEKIIRLEPSYVAGELPNLEPVKLPQTGGCYVATAVYGSYDCPQVWTLRRFRDFTLAETWYGRLFIRTYYAISPMLVKWFGNKEWFKQLWKPSLDRLVNKLNKDGVKDTVYEDRTW